MALNAPLSFWGGVDPSSGRIINPRHPDVTRSLAGGVVWLPEPIGSSSSASIVLELIRENVAPAALLLGKADAILAVGCFAAAELGYRAFPVVVVDPPPWPEGTWLLVEAADGTARCSPAPDQTEPFGRE